MFTSLLFHIIIVLFYHFQKFYWWMWVFGGKAKWNFFNQDDSIDSNKGIVIHIYFTQFHLNVTSIKPVDETWYSMELPTGMMINFRTLFYVYSPWSCIRDRAFSGFTGPYLITLNTCIYTIVYINHGDIVYE